MLPYIHKIQKGVNKMALKITRTRQVNADFSVALKHDSGETEERIVKYIFISVDAEGVSTVSETMVEPELYAKNRRQMRKDEMALRELLYKIEDEVIAELEAKEKL